MAQIQRSTAPSASPARFVLYVAGVATIVMLLFPPFTSFTGIEYAFLLTGPEWSSRMGTLGESLGLTARVHWIALLVQIAALWAIALGATWFFGTGGGAGEGSPNPSS